jgi:hypothetical protein
MIKLKFNQLYSSWEAQMHGRDVKKVTTYGFRLYHKQSLCEHKLIYNSPVGLDTWMLV